MYLVDLIAFYACSECNFWKGHMVGKQDRSAEQGDRDGNVAAAAQVPFACFKCDVM